MTSSNLADLVAPGQEELLENIAEEIEAEQKGEGEQTPEQAMEEGEDEELIGGKFKSQEDLLNAYKELEKKQGQGSDNEEPEQKWEYENVKPDEYTEEIGKEIYGEGLTNSFTAAEINPLEMAEKVYAGEDVTEYVNALVEKGGLPEGAVITYLSGIAGSAYEKKGGAAAPTPELTDADAVSIKSVAGGDKGFDDLSRWMSTNLPQSDLDGYNAAIDSGNAAVAKFAVAQMVARKGSQADPQLISGGSSVATDTFQSDREALEARNKRDSRGKIMYEADSKYRAWYDKTLGRSDVFG